jgi:hypothetical protein
MSKETVEASNPPTYNMLLVIKTPKNDLKYLKRFERHRKI